MRGVVIAFSLWGKTLDTLEAVKIRKRPQVNDVEAPRRTPSLELCMTHASCAREEGRSAM